MSRNCGTFKGCGMQARREVEKVAGSKIQTAERSEFKCPVYSPDLCELGETALSHLSEFIFHLHY